MKFRFSAVLGPLVGLLLGLLLLWPEPDGPTLAARGFSRIVMAEIAPDVDTPILKALQERQQRLATIPAEVRWQGNALSGKELAPFRRGLEASINVYNDRIQGNNPLKIEWAIPLPDQGVTFDLQTTGDVHHLTLRSRAGDSAAQDTWTEPGRGSLLPPLLAILTALLFRKVLPALFLGIWAGATIAAAGPGGNFFLSLPRGLADVFTHYLWIQITDTFRVEILGFVVALVAMVGIMSRSGGVQGMIELLVRFARTVRSTLMATFGMGVLIFFDDYANCLLVGSTMRPLTDRLRVSREKLAYIVDSTAAPIAGVSLLSTWIAFEVSTFSAQLPGVGITESAYTIFLQTLPYRFYCFFTLAFVLITILTGRDFGPMLKAERRARKTGAVVAEGSTPMVGNEMTRITPLESMPQRWWNGALPISSVLFVTIWRIFVDGGGLTLWEKDGMGIFTSTSLQQILYAGSGAAPIFVGATAGMILSAFLVGSRPLQAGILTGFAVATWWAEPLGQALSGSPAVGAGIAYVSWFLAFGMTAVLTTKVLGALRLKQTPHFVPWSDLSRAAISSTQALFFAVLILLQAWMIGAVCEDVGTADYLVALLADSMPPPLLPVLLFLVSCLVAFSTGSSWSTMSILLPNVVALAYSIGASGATSGSESVAGLAMVVMSIGAVLEGSIFGDHCSPISDTTVLSSVSSASDHLDHVRTQAPYAVTTACVAISAGYLPSILFEGWTFPMAMVTGIATLTGIQLLFGRRADEPPLAQAS